MAKKVTTGAAPKKSNPLKRKAGCEGQIFVSKIYKERGVLVSEDGGETEQIKVQTIAPDVPVAHVEYASQMTINLGNFESVQCRVGVTLPAYIEELEDAYQAAQHFVDTRLTRVVSEVREYREKSKGDE